MEEKGNLVINPEEKVEILPNGKLTVDKPAAKVGFLYVEIYGQDAGRIVFDQRKGKLELMFNQTPFGLDNCKKSQKSFNLEIRRKICEALGGTDVTSDLGVKR